MNEKIKNYVDLLFEDVPRSQKANELRNELLSNLNDRYEALIAEGKTENEAYGLAVAELGNVDELIKDLMPDKEITERVNAERKRKAFFTSIAIFMYIISCALFPLLDMLDINENISITVFFLIIAVATGLLIYVNMSTPVDLLPYLKSTDDDFDTNYQSRNTKSSSAHFMRSVENFFWLVVVVLYFGISFSTGAWQSTWLIFLVGAAIWQGIKLVMLYRNERGEK